LGNSGDGLDSAGVADVVVGEGAEVAFERVGNHLNKYNWVKLGIKTAKKAKLLGTKC
jgi:hypothetical protein